MKYPDGWNGETALYNRLCMYRRFNKKNPKVEKVGSILTIIFIVECVAYLASAIYYFIQIDNILKQEYMIKKSNDSYGVMFDDDLKEYIEENLLGKE
jgi:hypothetical protein